MMMMRHLSQTIGRRLVQSHVGKVTTSLHPIAATDSSLSRCFSTKVKKKEKNSSKGDTARGRELELMLACIDAPKTKPPPVDDEEMARREQIRKAYTIGKFKEHNEDNHDIACKLRMKRHAINLLPKGSALKEKALRLDDKDDDNFPPRWRHIPSWTPPIKGFDPTPFTALEE